MAVTLPINSVWTRKSMRRFSSSPVWRHIQNSTSKSRPRPACCHIASPLLVLSLRWPRILSSRRLVVGSPLDAPPSHPLVILSCCLSLSCHASWLSHHHLLSSSHCTILSLVLSLCSARQQQGEAGRQTARRRRWAAQRRVARRRHREAG